MNPLTQLFIETDFDDAPFIAQYYKVFAVSFFDHVLTEEEYINADLVCYADVKNDPLKQARFNHIANQFNALYSALYEQANGYVLVAFDGTPVEVISFEQYYYYVNNALKEKPLCCFLFPSLGCFARAGYDLTHQFFMFKNHPQTPACTIQKIKAIVAEVGLRIIE